LARFSRDFSPPVSGGDDENDRESLGAADARPRQQEIRAPVFSEPAVPATSGSERSELTLLDSRTGFDLICQKQGSA
jgi:hypothetical protein